MPLVRKGGDAPPSRPDPAGAEAQLRAGTSDERWAAARALSGQPQAAKALGAALAAELDPRVREALLTGLVAASARRKAAHGDPGARPVG